MEIFKIYLKNISNKRKWKNGLASLLGTIPFTITFAVITKFIIDDWILLTTLLSVIGFNGVYLELELDHTRHIIKEKINKH